MDTSPAVHRVWPEMAVNLCILIALTVLAVGAWGLMAWEATAADTFMMAGVPMSVATGGRIGLGSAIIFLASWLAMMIAMMIPSAWPVVLIYAKTARSTKRGSIPLFLAGYLVIWEGFGLLAYSGYIAVGAIIARTPVLATHLSLLTGALVALAGLYQFTSLKGVCLRHCQSPLGFLIGHWRAGALGGLHLGVAHGWHCFGCCLGLMVALLALGLMDLRWMAGVTVIVALEKLGPRHPAVSWAIGASLMILGVVTAVWTPIELGGMR